MPLPEELLKTVHLSARLHDERNTLRDEAKEMLGFACLKELTRAQLNGLVRFVLQADDKEQVSSFLKKQMQRRAAQATGLNSPLPGRNQTLAEHLEQYFAETLWQKACEAAKTAYQSTCLALGKKQPEKAPLDFAQEAWRRLAREFAGYIAGWHRIKTT
ncbi:MAG: hypothetical protein DDT38_00120 [Firmicutes bacterium]|nr:hypothetical protein [candidate division NPL-UPA2 bacterium]